MLVNLFKAKSQFRFINAFRDDRVMTTNITVVSVCSAEFVEVRRVNNAAARKHQTLEMPVSRGGECKRLNNLPSDIVFGIGHLRATGVGDSRITNYAKHPEWIPC